MFDLIAKTYPYLPIFLTALIYTYNRTVKNMGVDWSFIVAFFVSIIYPVLIVFCFGACMLLLFINIIGVIRKCLKYEI